MGDEGTHFRRQLMVRIPAGEGDYSLLHKFRLVMGPTQPIQRIRSSRSLRGYSSHGMRLANQSPYIWQRGWSFHPLRQAQDQLKPFLLQTTITVNGMLNGGEIQAECKTLGSLA